MKKNVFLLAMLTVSIMISCDKEIQQNSNNPINSRTDPNHIEFEHNLNSSFVSTPMYIKVSKVHTISLSHTDGFISQSEKNRITGEVQSLVNSGVVPVLIDVDPDNSVVDVVEQFNVSSSESFVEVLSNGKMGRNGVITSGKFCNLTSDLAGGGVGRVGTKYYNNYINIGAFPANYDNVRKVRVYSGCSNATNTMAKGNINIRRTDFWRAVDYPNCTGTSECMSDSDLTLNYNTLKDAIINSFSNSNKKIIGVDICSREQVDASYYWDFKFYFVNVLDGPPTYQ